MVILWLMMITQQWSLFWALTLILVPSFGFQGVLANSMLISDSYYILLDVFQPPLETSGLRPHVSSPGWIVIFWQLCFQGDLTSSVTEEKSQVPRFKRRLMAMGWKRILGLHSSSGLIFCLSFWVLLEPTNLETLLHMKFWIYTIFWYIFSEVRWWLLNLSFI